MTLIGGSLRKTRMFRFGGMMKSVNVHEAKTRLSKRVEPVHKSAPVTELISQSKALRVG